MNTRFVVPRGLVMLLLASCVEPTAPSDTACTLAAHYLATEGFPAFTVRACYRICPDSAESWAATHNQELQRGYRC